MTLTNRLVVAALSCVVFGATSATVSADPRTPPLTMGQLALLRASMDASLIPSLKMALGSPDPGLRAVAARIAGVGRLLDVEDDIVAAMGKEQSDAVGAELMYAALIDDTPKTAAAVAAYLPHSGLLALNAYAEHLARVAPDRLVNALPDLTARGFDESRIVMMAATQHPRQRDALLRTWMHVTTGPSWREILGLLPPPSAASAMNRLLNEALEAPEGAIREQTVWQVVTWLADKADVDPALVSQAAVDRPGSSDSWEAFGRELFRRSLGGSPVDRTAIVKRDGRDQRSEAGAIVTMRATASERAALKDAVGASPARTAHSQTFVATTIMSPLRTVESPWPGFLTSLLDVTGCRLAKNDIVGTLALTYRTDGRPVAATVNDQALNVHCQAALGALTALTTVESDAPVVDGATQVVVFRPYSDVIACADAPVPSPSPKRPAGPAVIVEPKRQHSVAPIYPADARRDRIQGLVIVEAEISDTGCIRRARILRSVSPALDLSGMSAVGLWRYTPTRLDGVPVPTTSTFRVTFTLN